MDNKNQNNETTNTSSNSNLEDAENTLPLTQEDLKILQNMTLEQRKDWAKKQIFDLKIRLHRLAKMKDETPEQYRARKNAQKRTRRARNGK